MRVSVSRLLGTWPDATPHQPPVVLSVAYHAGVAYRAAPETATNWTRAVFEPGVPGLQVRAVVDDQLRQGIAHSSEALMDRYVQSAGTDLGFLALAAGLTLAETAAADLDPERLRRLADERGIPMS
jgi:hypothetical protein